MQRSFLFVGLFLAVAPVSAESVPAWVLRLPESTPTVFIAETSTSAFHRFDRVSDSVVRVRQDYMSIGQGGVGKERSGDQRTPLGVFFVTEQLDTSRLHEKYGVTAFPLDYPNAWDRRRGRTGDGIWVHGVDPQGGTRPALDTDGCIALPNDRLLALQQSFQANVTPVLIATELRWDDPGAVTAARIALEQALLHWADSLEQGDMYAWLNHYDDTFRHWGMNKEEWSAFSLETVGQRPIEEVTISDLLLLADPVEDGLYLSRFRLAISEGESRKVISVRRMYWRRSESGALKIVAEDSG